MAEGERIRFFRLKRNMTQKYLGMKLGFPENSADVRIAQYETEGRKPRTELTETLAYTLDVSPQALTVPDIDSPVGLMHTLFALEDTFGLFIDGSGGDVCLRINGTKGQNAAELRQRLTVWRKQAAKLKAAEISRSEYDHWRYHYPKAFPEDSVNAPVDPQESEKAETGSQDSKDACGALLDSLCASVTQQENTGKSFPDTDTS